MQHAVTKFVASLIALGGLLGGVASHATDIAELPLKASVLAKPNVVFGVDDSSSMDFEIMINANDGSFWWDYTNKSGWDSTGAPWFNAAGTSSTQWRKMPYLFPNGSATGDRINLDSTNDHFAVMPSAQLAWLRSSSYNPLYYDPTVTYAAWSPAYVSGALTTYANATPSAAKSHPALGSDTMDLTQAQPATNVANKTFLALPGMVIPQNAQYCTYTTTSCSNGSLALSSWTTVTASTGYTVPASTVLRVTMAYWPATYYKKQTCTVDGSTCVSAPDGSSLKRYEIKPANYSTTAAYNADLQNFANWWQYYRKRKLMLAASIGQVLEPLTGLRMGVVQFNSQSTVTMYDIDSTSAATNGRKVAGLFYNLNTSGGTPTRETLKYIGDQYRNTTSTIQYACQRNNAFIVTDGFANATSVTPPTYSQTTWGSGVPYQNITTPSLADIALSYYTINLRSTLATGQVAVTSTDLNTNLHMNTYGLTLGAKGTIFVDETTPVPTSATAWPTSYVDRNPTAVDDLWHATINGRGKMYTATTPQATAVKIQAGLNDILNNAGAQGGVAISSVNLSRGDGYAYLGSYTPAGWSGDLTANTINASTGVISTTPTWSGASVLGARDYSTRVIASATTGGGVGFTSANVGSLVNPGNVWGDSTQLMNYLRGDRTNEGTLFRTRTSLMGAVITSEPTISSADSVVYISSGEGMLHAFDITPGSTAGKELWAFVPRAVLGDIGQTSARAYTFKTQLDGTPVIGPTGSTSKLLVAGMGAAGRSYYAIDVSSPRSLSEAQLASAYKWEFPSASDSTMQSKVGQTLGKPAIVKTASNGYVVLVTSGYNSTYDGKGRMWMLNASTGAVIHEFVVNAGSLTAESGLAQISPYAEDDGTVQYVYGGDLLGNVWRFDLQGQGTPNLVAVLKSSLGDLQPVTAAPELASIQGQRVVIVGTGRILDITDFGSTKVQTIYAISDGATINPARTSLVQQTYTRSTDTITSNAVDWTSRRGWYMDLTAGEQANTHPTLAYGAVSFVSNITGATDCTASSYFYVLDVASGGKSSSVSYVSSVVSSTANSTGDTAVGSADGSVKYLMRTYDGQVVEKQGPNGQTVLPSRNAWHEIRQE
jgi:type IV pilus assembly protein PilY1